MASEHAEGLISHAVAAAMYTVDNPGELGGKARAHVHRGELLDYVTALEQELADVTAERDREEQWKRYYWEITQHIRTLVRATTWDAAISLTRTPKP